MAGEKFISNVKENFDKGLEWGGVVAKQTYDVARDTTVAVRDGALVAYGMAQDAVVAGYTVVRDGVVDAAIWARDGVVRRYTLVRDGVVDGYVEVRDGVVTVYQNGKEAVKGGIGDFAVQAAIKGSSWATSDKDREQALVSAIDKRSLYTAKEVCVECQSQATMGHPNPNDGQFLGDNCTPSPTVPKLGKLPADCKPGCKLPRIFFTNGINNTEAQVCETLQKLAEIKCAEVVGIYNATFADSAKVASPGRAPAPLAEDKQRSLFRVDQKIGDAIDNKVASTKFRLADNIGRTGLTQDVLDCLDNIDAAGTEKAAHTQGDMVFAALSSEPPTPVTLYAHSQGGLITQEALVQSHNSLYSRQYAALIKQGKNNFQAQIGAHAYAMDRMKRVNVVSFGTAESNWVNGPAYAHYTNTRDPVPALIKQVLASRGVDVTVTGGVVDSFTVSPSFNPMDAHGMKETYLPRLQEKAPAARKYGKCCA